VINDIILFFLAEVKSWQVSSWD